MQFELYILCGWLLRVYSSSLKSYKFFHGSRLSCIIFHFSWHIHIRDFCIYFTQSTDVNLFFTFIIYIHITLFFFFALSVNQFINFKVAPLRFHCCCYFCRFGEFVNVCQSVFTFCHCGHAHVPR